MYCKNNISSRVLAKTSSVHKNKFNSVKMSSVQQRSIDEKRD